MTALRAIHRESGRTIAERVVVARTFTARLRGWVGRLPAAGEGLWLPRCACVHTIGLRIAIDVIWCGRCGVIRRVDRFLPPWRMAAARGATDACEVAAGGAAGLAPGDHLGLTENADVAAMPFCYDEARRIVDGR